MNKNIFKRFIGFCLAIVMVVGCALSLTGCGKQETEDATGAKSLAGTTWLADYFVSDSFGKLTLEESIEQGYMERDSSYVLEFADEETCYIRMVHGDTTSSEEKLSYEFDGKKLTFLNGNVSDAEYDVSDGITLTHAAGSDMTTFHFVLRDGVNSETDPRPENQSQNETQPSGQLGSDENNEVQLSTDGEYVYRVGDCEFTSDINIWDYIDDTDFDLYGLLEDNGYAVRLRGTYIYRSNMERVDYEYQYIDRADSDGAFVIFTVPMPTEHGRAKNNYGLYPISEFTTLTATFAISETDMEDAKYSINGTDLGMSIDQISIMAYIMTHTPTVNNIDDYRAVFSSLLTHSSIEAVFIIL